VLSTIHPSAVLRAPDGTSREEAFSGLVADLALARDALAS
jgi:uracil-DNA glycosylase